MAEIARLEFTMSYPDLITVCNTIHTFMVRDAAEFLANFGVTALITTAFDTKINEFESYPSDEILQGLAQQKTQDKDAIANNLRIKIRSVAVRAKNVFGENSGSYNAFGVKDMNNFDDGNLLACGRRVAQMGETYLTQLAHEGLTNEILDDLLDTCNDFEDAGKAQKLAFANRSDSAKVRVDKANELYRMLVKYCDYGKDIWFNTNPARYANYVIYNASSPGALSAPTGVHFSLENMKVSWTAVTNATSYSVSISSDGEEYSEMYSGVENFFVLEPAFYGQIYLTVKARNQNGFGPSSEPYIFYYYDVLPVPEGLNIVLIPGSTNMIRLTWQAVGSANAYKVYRCTVPTGMPLGELSYIAEQSNLMYEGAAIAGMRNWYAVKAANETQMSLTSDAVFLDIEAAPE